ncbi:asparaginase [Hordeum vulgare]|nr:asparaginase [Hordeum vulgare]
MAPWAIAIHGGAGVDPNLPEHRQEEAKRVLARCLQVGVGLLRAGATALDVVEAVVWELETDPRFNSGRGSALTRAGTVNMEASIMDGCGRRYGVVSTVRNPVSLARRVRDKSLHSYLAFHGAEDFTRQQVATSSSHNCVQKIRKSEDGSHQWETPPTPLCRGYSTHPCAILVAAQAHSPQRSFMRFHVFGSPFNDVVDTAALRAVSGSDASSTYTTWLPRALTLSQNRLPHSDAMRISTPCGTSSSFGCPMRPRSA